MASKKGIIVTAVILGAITGASFLLWVIPQDVETTFVVTDYRDYLDDVKNIHEVLEQSIDLEYQNLQTGEITPEKYIAITEVTSDQVTTQIGEFITSKPSEEWQSSYISYMNAMKSFNSYIIETKVLANMIESGNSDEEMKTVLDKIEMLKIESKEFVKESDQSRPD